MHEHDILLYKNKNHYIPYINISVQQNIKKFQTWLRFLHDTDRRGSKELTCLQNFYANFSAPIKIL